MIVMRERIGVAGRGCDVLAEMDSAVRMMVKHEEEENGEKRGKKEK